MALWQKIKCCSELVKTPAHQFEWQIGDGGYQWVEVGTQHGGINQRWLLVFSKQAYEREKKTCMRRLEKERIALSKSCWQLGNEMFDCPADAEKSVQQLKKNHRFHNVTYEIKTLEKFAVSGRPNAMTPKIIQAGLTQNSEKWIFQIMEGISIVKTSTEAIITNIDVLRCKIIRLFGVTACHIYGLQPELAEL